MRKKLSNRRLAPNGTKSAIITLSFIVILFAVVSFYYARIAEQTKTFTKDLFGTMADNTAALISFTGEEDTEKLADILSSAKLDPTGLCVEVDSEGAIIATNNAKGVTISGDNILDNLSAKSDEMAKISRALKSGKDYYAEAKMNGYDKVVFIRPVKGTTNSVMYIINTSYFNHKTKGYWKHTASMIHILYAILVAFVLFHMVISSKVQREMSRDTRELENKADSDLLTGLYNKIATERGIKEYIANNPDTPGMMILIDVDDFKKINDTKGHAFGDAVLKSLGEGLGSQFRYTDIVGRIGGDEFMVFLKNIDGEEPIRREAEKLIRFFDDFTAGDEYIKYSATASIGVALYPSEGDNFDALYKATDKALYKSKNNGKKQLNFYNDEWPAVKA